MAKRKAKAKKKTSSRRSVGAMSFNPNSLLVKLGSVAVGFLAADKINEGIDKIIKPNPAKADQGKLVAAGQIGIGGYYNFMHKGKKNLLLAAGTGILAGAGLKRLKDELDTPSAVAGYGQVPVIGRRRIAGYQGVPVLGYRTSVNGYDTPGILGGYNVNPKPVNVMGAVDGGSGLTNSAGGSMMQ